MSININVALAGLLWLASALMCSAQTAYTVSGTITDADVGGPLPGAVVHLHETGASAVTDAQGNFTLQNVRAGTYHLHVHMLGFAELKQTIVVSDNVHFNFKLKPAAIEMHEIIVEGEYLKADRKEVTLPVEVAGNEFLNEQLSVSLAQTLEKIPGITSINTGVGISKPVLRGFTGPRVLVNDQGIQQQGQDWGMDHGLEMDAFSAERIEVIKGPATIMYGSGAIGGAINILPPAIPPVNTYNGELAGVYRSMNNTYGSYASLKANKNNNYFIVKGSFQDFGDYRVPAENFTYNTFVLPLYKQQLKNTAGNEASGAATAGILRNWGNARVTVSNYYQTVGLFPGAIGTPRYYQLLSDGNSRDINLPRQVNNHFKVLGHTQVMLNKNWLEVDAGYQSNLRREESIPHGHGFSRPTDSTALHLRLNTFSLRPKYHFNVDTLTKVISGLDAYLKKNEISGFEFLIPEYTEFSTAGYLLANRKMSNRVFAAAGVRAGYNTIGIQPHTIFYYDNNGTLINKDQRVAAAQNNYFNYSASLGATWLWKENVTVRFNAGRSFRNPNIAELAENGIHHGTFRHEKGNPEIITEKGWQADAGIELERKKFSGRVTSFYNYFDNYIFLRPTAIFSQLPAGGQLYEYTQTRAIYTGFESFADYHPVEQFHLSNTIEFVYAVNLENNLPLPFIPPLKSTTSAAYEWHLNKKVVKNLKVGVEHEVAANQNRVARNERATPGFNLVNLFLSGKFGVKDQLFNVYLRVDNLFDTTYLNHLSRYRILNLPEPGRNINLLLKIPINSHPLHIH